MSEGSRIRRNEYGIGSYVIAFKEDADSVKDVEITEVDIAQAVVDVEDHVYTGSAVKPAYTVTLDGKKLTAGTDFNVVFSNNVNVGTAAILTVTGTGNYKEQLSHTLR